MLTQVYKRFLQYILLFIMFISLQACSQKHLEPLPPQTEPPEITTAYLLEHRIISYAPQLHEKILSTLPYEMENFEERYRFHLIARLPDTSASDPAETHYYLWLVRYADNWRDFTAAYSNTLGVLKIEPHYSNIRQGVFYEEYTVDFTLEQLKRLQTQGLSLTLFNNARLRSEIFLPPEYLQAFLQLLKEQENQ